MEFDISLSIGLLQGTNMPDKNINYCIVYTRMHILESNQSQTNVEEPVTKAIPFII